jgi:hypothetical protein
MNRNHVVAGLSFLLIAAGFAQSPSAASKSKTKYDPAAQIKITAVVDDIEQRVPGGACKAQSVYVIVKADGQNYALYVGPKWFLDELTATFAKGDKLEVTGWKVVKEGSTDSTEASTDVVVRQIKRGDWVLDPRDDTGSPNWSWMKAPKDSGKCI